MFAVHGHCILAQEARHQRQVKQMQEEFAAMLNYTMAKLQQRLEERHTGKPPG